jgi:hypothetical protein
LFTPVSQYSGSCHCGNVLFTVIGEIEELTTCDCSLCVKKNAVMFKVHESYFELKTDWDKLGLYQWNTEVAKHYFCKNCGIYTFHRKRAAPDHYGINVYCLDDIDISTINIRKTEGATMTVECTSPRQQWPGPRR